MNTRREFLENLFSTSLLTPSLNKISFKERPKEIKMEHMINDKIFIINGIRIRTGQYPDSTSCTGICHSKINL